MPIAVLASILQDQVQIFHIISLSFLLLLFFLQTGFILYLLVYAITTILLHDGFKRLNNWLGELAQILEVNFSNVQREQFFQPGKTVVAEFSRFEAVYLAGINLGNLATSNKGLSDDLCD